MSRLDLTKPLCFDAPIGTAVYGNLCYTPARDSVASPKESFLWASTGPHKEYLDVGRCKWRHSGGDWIDAGGVSQGASPIWSFVANQVPSGSFTYVVNVLDGIKQCQKLGMHFAWILRCAVNRKWCGRHSDTPPRLVVSYADGVVESLPCVATVGFKSGSAYSYVGIPIIGTWGENSILEFSTRTQKIVEANLTITVGEHAAGNGLFEAFLIDPPMNPVSEINGLSQNYPMDNGIANHPDVRFSQVHRDGTDISEYIAESDKGHNVTYKEIWSPDIYSSGSADQTKLPYSLNGKPIKNKFIHGQRPAVPPVVVPSTYQGEGFYPVAPGIGALKITIPGANAPDGANVGSAGSLGSDLWWYHDAIEAGIIDHMFTRYSLLIGKIEEKPIAQKPMYRTSDGGLATYVQARGKSGFGGQHRTIDGGNNRVGGGAAGWSSRTIHIDLCDMLPGCVLFGLHSLDMFNNGDAFGTFDGNVWTGQQGARYRYLERGKQYQIETELLLNTWSEDKTHPTRNGEFRMWIYDGDEKVLVIDFRGFSFRQGPLNADPGDKYLHAVRQLGAMGGWVNFYQGGIQAFDVDQTFFLSAIVASTSPIGPIKLIKDTAMVNNTTEAAPVIDFGTMAWSPTRDANDVINDGNWKGLPANKYVFVDSPPLLSAVEKPYYVARSGAPSWTGIVNVWNGAAWNPNAQEMFITGGGHFATSSCETAIYRLKASTLLFDRARDRDPQSENGSWSIHKGELVFTPGENFSSVVLRNSQHGALHTYHGILWVPPELMAIIRGDKVNVSGGIFQTNIVRYVYDLDARSYVGVPNWRKSPDTDIDISDSAAFIEGTAIYGPHHSYDVWKWELTGTQDTNWSTNSTGVFTKVYQQWGHIVSSHSVWGWLPERRECFGFYGSNNANELSFQRCRYGQAIDSKAASWTKYVDTLKLTSLDGSHLDFNKTSLSSDNMPAGDLYGAGYVYDHDAATLYVQGSNVGAPLYKITGIDGTTWSTQKIPGAEALACSKNGVFGRMRMARLGGQKILIRVSDVDHKVQVMRLVDAEQATPVVIPPQSTTPSVVTGTTTPSTTPLADTAIPAQPETNNTSGNCSAPTQENAVPNAALSEADIRRVAASVVEIIRKALEK